MRELVLQSMYRKKMCVKHESAVNEVYVAIHLSVDIYSEVRRRRGAYDGDVTTRGGMDCHTRKVYISHTRLSSPSLSVAIFIKGDTRAPSPHIYFRKYLVNLAPKHQKKYGVLVICQKLIFTYP